MKTEYFISKLKEQKSKLDVSELEVWLKTTYAFIEEYFGAISSRTQNFKSVINDFTTGKILGFSDGAIKNYKLQALEYIDEIYYLFK